MFLLCLDIVGARGEKKPKFSSKKLWKNAQFCFFSLERLVRHLITKTCKHLVHSSLFEAKKIQLFLNFVAIFLNLLFIGLHIYCFSSNMSSWNVRTARNFARTLWTWVSLIPQIFRFFRIFLLFFSGRSKLFDRTVTTQKGISIRAPNGGGANLSRLSN